jgi:hypothetical protein
MWRDKMNVVANMKTKYLLALSTLFTFSCFIIIGCESANEVETQHVMEKTQQQALPIINNADSPSIHKESEAQWEVVANFGMITTIYISPYAMGDRFLIAQILHNVTTKYGNRRIVWFFNDKSFTPKGVPMTDSQILHWVGVFNPIQSKTFSYVEIVNENTSPPEVRLVSSKISPGYTD